jgi:hypothetical protein
MTDSTLERDLRRRIDDKLRRWVRDSLDLYEMAGLPERRLPSRLRSAR